MPSVNLLDILKIDVILEILAPHLPFPDIQNLSSINKGARILLRDNPLAYRRFDLSVANGTTHDLFHGLISSQQGLRLLTYARILILDHQAITADFLREVLLSGHYQVRILSIIGRTCLGYDEFSSITKLLSHHAELIPASQRLRGIYFFEYITTVQPSSKYSDGDGMSELSAGTEQDFYTEQDLFTAPRNVASSGLDEEAAAQISASQGHLMFNAVLCRGPRHDFQHPKSIGHRIAGYIIGPQGCSNCGTLPEGPASDLQTHFPLISPPPFYGFSVETATQPPYGADGKPLRFFARCKQCADRAFCTSCGKFFCEDCDASTGPSALIDWPVGVGVRRCEACENPCVACRLTTFTPCHDCDMYFCKLSAEGARQLLVDSVEAPEDLNGVDLVSFPYTNLGQVIDDS